jgi:hypothetical protein|tara:strand:+ start:277 stop:450 length:174 start_codon:yes stop_codon:yes gene_type:complete
MKRFLNIKGMLLMVYATANYYSAFGSFTFLVFILSLDTLLNSFKTGAIILQGPHQSA